MWFWMMESNNIYLWLLQLSLMSLCPPCPCISRTASPSHLSSRPLLDVPKSLVLRPHVPGPHTRVSMSPSPCPCPSFIHSHKFVVIQQMHDTNYHQICFSFAKTEGTGSANAKCNLLEFLYLQSCEVIPPGGQFQGNLRQFFAQTSE